jgi:hypothetical protein
MPQQATLELDAGPEIANWRPLVHWLLAIPHLILAEALQTVGQIVSLIAWFAIVFTGAMPEGLVGIQCLSIRYQARALSYAGWLREPYPAFDFSTTQADPGGDPLRIELPAQLTDRNRLTVGLRLLWIIPAAVFGWLLAIGAGVVLLISFFAVLFTGRWPDGMRTFVVGCLRWYVRFTAYARLLTDDYPPFAVD